MSSPITLIWHNEEKVVLPRHSIDLPRGHSSTDPATSGTAYGASPTGYIGRPNDLSKIGGKNCNSESNHSISNLISLQVWLPYLVNMSRQEHQEERDARIELYVIGSDIVAAGFF
jgi:hypothetical protein